MNAYRRASSTEYADSRLVPEVRGAYSQLGSRSLRSLLEPEMARRLPVGAALEIVQQALLLFQEFYAHLTFKQALHAVDPVRQLELLLYRLTRRLRSSGSERSATVAALAFHREMTAIFASVRDRHVRYFWPDPFRSHWAWLGCQIEEYWTGDEGPGGEAQRHYLVTRSHPRLAERGFVRGSEVLYWNGLPIDVAVAVSAERNPGSNEEARRAFGLDRLTLIPLSHAPPPEELWVDVTYRPPGPSTGKPARTKRNRLHWRVIEYSERDPELASTSAQPETWPAAGPAKIAGSEIPQAVDHAIDQASDQRRKLIQHLLGFRSEKDREELLFEVRSVGGGGRFDFTYLRLFSFDSDRIGRTVELIQQRLHDPQHSQSGLIVDIRDNPGGAIQLAEYLLAGLTPRPTRALRFQFPVSDAVHQLASQPPSSVETLGPWQRWRPSIEDALSTGEKHSQALPLTSLEDVEIRQLSYGPVVLITSARSYSAADMFAAGFQDNEVGRILGVHRSTGAGGANVVEHARLHEKAVRAGLAAPLVPTAPGGGAVGQPAAAAGRAVGRSLARLRALPAHRAAGPAPRSDAMALASAAEARRVRMSISLRRCLRVGENLGRPLEDLGVQPDRLHRLRKDDLLETNRELERAAVEMLLSQPLMAAELRVESAGVWRIRIEVRGVRGIRVFVVFGSPIVKGLPTREIQRVPGQGNRVELRFVDSTGTESDRFRADQTQEIVLREVPEKATGAVVLGTRSGEVVGGWVLQRP